MNKIRFVIPLIAALLYTVLGNAQPGAEIEVQKPKKYENRKLPSEKTGEKKFTVTRKLYQNTVTHYNYYFNANNRLNDVVAAAKGTFKEDYSQLLPFYNYTLEATAQSKTDLDSIVYKCTAGILLHDLRNSWIDNMYLLLAKAYFFRKDFDSAGYTLQYLNFSYAPKEAGNYDIPIGSNASNDKGEFSIATKEKNSIWTKLTSRPPSRNESFIWQIRNHIEKDELPEAAGIIEILRHDPNFPKRLKIDLDEAVAYWYYKQQVYDSAAIHLSNSLDNAANKQEKARWEYLIAQMYQLSKKYDKAVEFYNRCISHTSDAIMDVYARLNSIRIKRSDKTNYIQENIDALLKMAKRDKYQSYRDIIYYAAAKIELERNDFNNAQKDLLKSVEYSTSNPLQRSQSFLLLADLNYNRKSFSAAYNFYDSTDVSTLGAEDKDRVTLRKPPLQIIAENTSVITKEDSLQALAKLPAAERDAIIKKQAKLLRSAQGLKEEEPGNTNPAVRQVTDLFATNNQSSDFYFYNAAVKARGFSEFRTRWGERPNVDNWRRKTAIDRQTQIGDVEDTVSDDGADGEQKKKVTDNSVEGLTQNIPLTPEKLDESNKNIMTALFTLGKTFISPLEEYAAAIEAYEELLRRFPSTSYREEAWFNLIYAYQKTGDKSKSDVYKNRLLTDSADNKWVKLIKNPDTGKKSAQENPATKKYEEIYNLFIEGKFDQAKNEKSIADSLYGNSFWTPQLLYIESVYYIKQQEDAKAIKVLTDLSNLYTDNPMAEKANTMIDVLKRRKEIVDYLIKLKVTRNVDKAPSNQASTPVISKRIDTTLRRVSPDSAVAKKDTGIVRKPVVLKNFSLVTADSQYVVILLDKVDKVYVSEAGNAFNRFNREKFYNQKINISNLQLDERYNMVLQGPFTDANAAIDYIDKVKPVAKSRILPWLTPEKYSFIVVSNANLEVLKSGKDMDTYKQLLQKAFPGKF